MKQSKTPSFAISTYQVNDIMAKREVDCFYYVAFIKQEDLLT